MQCKVSTSLPSTILQISSICAMVRSAFNSQQPQNGATTIVEPKTKRGKRVLEARAPKLVEDPRRLLVLYGNKTSLVGKNVLVDLQKLKWNEAVKYSKKNQEAKPFEPGGEAAIERWAHKADCTMFALATHTKKRPHNLVLGRLYDYHVYDMLELGVERHVSLQHFGNIATTQLGNKPCLVFLGDGFDSDPALRLARSMLLDLLRGRQVATINLAGLDRVIFVTHGGNSKLFLRQYRIYLKKSGTKVPRVVLQEMGPALDLVIRRHREAPSDLEKEAHKKPKELVKKKEKNVEADVLEGKVGRIYMPQQQVDTIALRKMKGLKRERREGAAEAADSKRARKNAAEA